jgi:hypothetical protein
MMRQFIPISVMFIALVISGCTSPSGNNPSSIPLEVRKEEATTEVQIPQDTALPNLYETATAPAPLMVATSRGDKLVATDPASVNLSAGVPTLVEFFRFT